MGLPENWVGVEPDDGNRPSRMGKWLDLASRGIWWDEERGLPRVVEAQDDRVSKLKTLGNGIVPMCIPIFLRVHQPQWSQRIADAENAALIVLQDLHP